MGLLENGAIRNMSGNLIFSVLLFFYFKLQETSLLSLDKYIKY